MHCDAFSDEYNSCSAALDPGSGDLVKKEDQAKFSNGNDESGDCTDNAIPVKNELS